MKRATKAIIPVAGYGARRLPITKSIEKCMLPLGNRPVIDYIVRDCVAAGITDIYFVVSGAAEQLRSYYSRNIELERAMAEKGKTELIEGIMPPDQVTFHYIQQDLSDGRYGTTVPVWLCRDYIDSDELVLVVMGDDVTYVASGISDIERLIDIESPAILGVPVPDGPLDAYGVIKLTAKGVFEEIIEKPTVGTEPSRMINVSKYVLPGTFFELADISMHNGPNQSGEYFITDPLNTLVHQGTKLQVVQARGAYLDSGSVEAWVNANVWLLHNT